MPVPFSSALYYPYIDIKNEHWLRSAALYWDSIRTIVPVSHRHPYSNKFASALYDEGILNPVRVSSDMDEVEELTDKVLEYLTDPASASVLFNMDDHPTRRIHSEKISHELRELYQIHPEKLSHKIRSALGRGLNDDGWLHVAPGFANFYMTLLASQLAERLGLGLITESSAADQLAIAVRKGKPLGTSDTRRVGRQFDAYGSRRSLPTDLSPSLLIDLMVQGISLPEHLSVNEILKFKDYHADELAIFRREVARLTAELPVNASIEALRETVSNQYKTEVLPAMQSLRKSLRAQRWEAGFSGLLKVTLLSVTPTTAAVLAGVPSTLALVAGAGISLTATAVLIANQTQRTRMDNPYSYLLSLEREW
ncbi:hypothetical protein DMX02_01345 [Pseudomonas jessenii]|nr:hypothetical protein DMX02_01345 [Pseudomonas jessenii]